MFTLEQADEIHGGHHLDQVDIDRANAMLAEMPREKVWNYLCSWAAQYAHESYCDGMAARRFEDAAYGRD